MDDREPDERGHRGREERAGRGLSEPGRREYDRARPPRAARRTARLAIGYVAEMTGREPEGITSLKQADDGRWLVGVEVVEKRRIPESTDILAVYEAELDADGELLAYRRVKRYTRCQVGEN